jgi:hypothetical protein
MCMADLLAIECTGLVLAARAKAPAAHSGGLAPFGRSL